MIIPATIERKIENPVSYNQYTQALLKAADNGNVDSWVYDIAEKVVEAKTKASDKDAFIRILEETGVHVEWNDQRKHVVYQIKEGNGARKKIRGSTLEKYFHIAFDKETLEGEFREKNEYKQRDERIMHGADLSVSGYSEIYADGYRPANWKIKSLAGRKGRSR